MMRPAIHFTTWLLCAAALGGACAPSRTPSGAAPPPAVRYFYTDLDGTLLDHNSAIPRVNLEALARYRRRGGRVGFATGRMPRHARAFGPQLRADLPLIYANGAVITDPRGKLLRMLVITDPADVRALCARIVAAGCRISYIAYGDPRTGAITMHSGVCAPPTRPGLGVVKIRARICPAGKLDALTRDLATATKGRYDIVQSGLGRWHGVSVGHRDVGKSRALAWVLRRLRLPPTQLAFVGDSGNDVGAARWLHRVGGRCFVVKNGIPSLKAACPHHTRRKHQDGAVAEVLDRLLRRR
jgi:hydroxymethylpyrimidine pyrophosphatase-like HAD family hydrolase